MIGQQQATKSAEQVGNRHPGRQHIAYGRNGVGCRGEVVVADRQQAAQGNQQHQRDTRAAGGRRHQLPGTDAAVLVARHVGARIGPADPGAGRHDSDTDNHGADRRRRGAEHGLPVDGGAEKPRDQQVERAKQVGGPLLNDQ